jgi:hypothetical protein
MLGHLSTKRKTDMKRDYKDGVKDDVQFFVGTEVEHTPAYGKKTLFVTGVQSREDIENHVRHNPAGIEHIFFGANQSFDPKDNLEWQRWESMIQHFLDQGYLCSLDIPMSAVEEFNDCGLCEYNNFIPQISVRIPYIKLWNYNTMLKIDDRDFNATNPGVWTHSLHSLMDRSVFTDWAQYKGDKVIE